MIMENNRTPNKALQLTPKRIAAEFYYEPMYAYGGAGLGELSEQ